MNANQRFGWGSVFAAWLIGLLIGWLAIGWGVWPVTWKNTDPVDLRQTAREEYLVMVANDYATTRDANTALLRLETWDPLSEAGREIRELATYYQAQGKPDVAQRLRALADGVPLPGVEAAPAPEEPPPPADEAILPDWARQALWGVVVLLAVAGLVALALYLLRLRKSEFPPDRLRERRRVVAEAAAGKEERPTPAAKREGLIPQLFTRTKGGKAPLSWDFEATYEGEGAEFDRTFTIEEKDDEGKVGQYFGECGVGAATFVGEDMQRVKALEVWLFDKSDIRTVAKVLMSPHAYGDQAIREEMAARGEPMLAVPGKTFPLVGHNLRAEAEIEDVQYLPGEPPDSAFARVSIRLRVNHLQV